MLRNILIFLGIFTVACGDVSITAQGGDLGGGGDVAADGAGDVGLAPDATEASDVQADVPLGDECTTDYDCLGLAGKSSCKLPHCNGGTCELAVQPVGAPCQSADLQLSDCTAGRCTVLGQCAALPVPDGKTCGLGSCGKKCAAGQCVAASDGDYDDGNPCTKDFCDQGIQVRNLPITDLSVVCDDGNACTAGDTCMQGKCTGQKQDCSDGIGCTQDDCEAKQGCAHTPDAKLCEGPQCVTLACDLAKGCTATGVPIGKNCDDGDSCTQGDACAVSGSVGSGGPPGSIAPGVCTGASTCTCALDADCKVTNKCLGTPKCSDGKCINDPKQLVQCDVSGDGPCLKTACDPAIGQCKAEPAADGKACDDGDMCTASSSCNLGKCAGQEALACDDKNACTTDGCSPVTGCVHTPAGGKCDDGNACTTSDTCVNGGCLGSTTGCEDSAACTLDTCDAATGKCSHKVDASLCDDGNPCTTDGCDGIKGCVASVNDTGMCSDGDACTQDSCKGGKCTSLTICECKADGECDDKNPCTADTCTAGKCGYAVADGKACDSGDKCQQPLTGTCAAGSCKSGSQPVDCSAKANACNTAACDPATGTCESAPKSDGTSCDADGNGCTVGDACQAGKCAAGAAADCAAVGDACNSAACKSGGPGAFTCAKQALPKGMACDDGKFCTTGEACDGQGACGGGGQRSCAEVATPCSPASCSEAAGKCVPSVATVSTACDDGLFCTTADHCDGKGGCAGGKALACPGGACLVGTCNENAKVCTQAIAQANAPCEDGNACTTGDSCDTIGKCLGGVAKVCQGDSCNDASCDPASGGCSLKPKAGGTACSDGLPCTLNDACSNGKCVGGVLKSCPGDTCHEGVCDAATGSCGQTNKANDTPCDDANACTASDKCAAGSCKGVYTCACQPATGTQDCNDKNPCTADFCELTGGVYKCVNAFKSTASCDDGNACTTGDSCATGGCAGKAIVCNDNNECTLDSCSGGVCSSVPNPGLACTDGSVCTSQDVCAKSGACVGNPVSCNDGQVCTDDSCDPLAGCKKVANAAACTDGNACTIGDGCGGGVCVAGKPNGCDDGNPCTSDACDVSSGACSHTANASACSDGNACTQNDVCGGGQCTPGAAIACSDGNACTDDACDTATGQCKFGNNAAACSDGNGCTVGDMCKFGTCYAGGAKNCSDNNVCTNDGCNAGSGGCVYAFNASACTDGNACTVSDMCSSGQCVSGAAASCNDNNACTTDSCNTLKGCSFAQAPDGKTCGLKKLCSKFPLQYAYPKCYAGNCEPAECFF